MTPLCRFFAPCCVLTALLISQQAFASAHAETNDWYSPENFQGYSKTWVDWWDYPDDWICLWEDDVDFGYPFCLEWYAVEYHVVAAAYFDQPLVLENSAEDLSSANAEWSGVWKPLRRANLGLWTGIGEHYYLAYSSIQECDPWSGCYPSDFWVNAIPVAELQVQVAPCFTAGSVIDQQAVSVIGANFPLFAYQQAPPFEFAVTLSCGGTVDQPQVSNFNDSFGTYYPPPPAVLDSCASKISVGPASVSGAHTHPYFRNLTELNAGAGCGHPPMPSTNPSDVQLTNQANFDFSQNDRNGIAGIGVPSGYVSEGKSFYLRVPTGGVIVRRETSNANVPNTQVFP